MNGVDSLKLAKEFCVVIREWMKPDEMQKVIALNRSEENPEICHTHDFYDANMAMDEAGERLGLHLCPDEDENGNVVGVGHTEDATNLWCEAWSIAKRAEFMADQCKEPVYAIGSQRGNEVSIPRQQPNTQSAPARQDHLARD
jgi:hypothetical protein